jgi:hypothetical protein
MSNVALKHDISNISIPRAFSVLEGGKGKARTTPDEGIVILGALLIAAQVLDGALTIGGVWTYGTGAEGNPMLRALMELIGLTPAVIVTKLACSALVVVLCQQAHSDQRRNDRSLWIQIPTDHLCQPIHPRTLGYRSENSI